MPETARVLPWGSPLNVSGIAVPLVLCRIVNVSPGTGVNVPSEPSVTWSVASARLIAPPALTWS